MATVHTWRLLRTKTGITDDAFGGATAPDANNRARSSVGPLRAIYVYVRPLTAGSVRVAPTTDTFSIAGVKVCDINDDNAVDSGDDTVLTATLAAQRYWTEIRIPMGGALVWSVQLTSMVAPATATQYEVRYREEPLLNRSES